MAAYEIQCNSEIEKADYGKVDEAIAKLNALNKDDYKDFSKVEAAVNAVVRDKDITEQDEVDAMAAAIEAAVAALERRTEAHDYSIIEGANGSWTQNSSEALTCRANGDLSRFTGIKVDGAAVDADDYTAKSGSTVISLKAEYLKTLPVGTHKLTVVYTDGECSTFFEVKKAASEQIYPSDGDEADAESPKTGDDTDPALLFALLLASAAAALAAIIYIKRKKRIR